MGYYRDGKWISSAAQKREREAKEVKGPRSMGDVVKKMRINKIRSEAGKKGGQTRAKQFAIERERKLLQQVKDNIKREEADKAKSDNLDKLLDIAEDDRKLSEWRKKMGFEED